MFTKVVPICLAVVFFRDFGNANVAGLAITCKSPPVYSGDRALVTCNFNLPVSTTRPAHFAVDFYPEGSTSPVEIAECTNLPDADLDCKAKRPGETFRITEDPEKLVFEIDGASTNHAGKYMCKVSTPIVDPPQLEPCRLTVSDRPRASDERRPSTQGYPSSSPSVDVAGSPEKDSGLNWMIVGPAAGGGAVVIILLICLAIFVQKRRKRSQPQKSSDAEENQGEKSPNDGQKETDAMLPVKQEDQHEAEGEENKEPYEGKRKGSTAHSDEVEVVAAGKQIGVERKLKNKEFPWDGSVENRNRYIDIENV